MVKIKRTIIIISFLSGLITPLTVMSQSLKPMQVISLIENHKDKEADEEINKVLISNPKSVLALYLKAVVSFKLNDIKTSQFYIKKIDIYDPHLKFARNKDVYFVFKKAVYDTIENPALWQELKEQNFLNII